MDLRHSWGKSMSLFGIVALTPFEPRCLSPAAAAVSACRAGETGVIDVEAVNLHGETIAHTLRTAVGDLFLAGQAGLRCGVSQFEDAKDSLDFLSELTAGVSQPLLILSLDQNEKLGPVIGKAQKLGFRVLVEVVNVEEAKHAQTAGANGVIAKGSESAGRVGEETALVLVQRLVAELKIAVWARGGIGPATASACILAGCAGVVVDSQLLLSQESPLTVDLKHKIARLDGTETVLLPTDTEGVSYRVFAKQGSSAIETAKEALAAADLEAFRNALWEPQDRVLFVGQDVAFAPLFSRRLLTTASILHEIRRAVEANLRYAREFQPIAEDSPLAQSHGTKYPIVQGAMTRVSDTAEFAFEVADGGALPFLALALMRKREAEALLKSTKEKLGQKPWGVGILGFVPHELRKEQIEVIERYKPPFALIAGGRPDQAKQLEDMGITTYLHVPSPGLLTSFVEMGSRRFIFEGRECGGHVGPRSSFVLWEIMIEELLNVVTEQNASQFHIVFAGGIHDRLSAAMVAAMAAPLAQRGVRIGLLMGTAYLFTKEAVESGAIVDKFQQAALNCDKTVLLETGPGHAIRCIDSPYKQTFDSKYKELLDAKTGRDEIREELELMNLGRLRLASKGLERPSSGHASARVEAEQIAKEESDTGSGTKLVGVQEDRQWNEGMYMIGQVAAMHHSVCTIAELHAEVSKAGTELLNSRCKKFAETLGVPQRTIVQDRGSQPEAIAIVGMSCFLPKANSIEEYWLNILNKVDTITEVPSDYWNWKDLYSEDPLARDKIYSKWGGFLGDVDIEPTRYGIPPASLEVIDPVQLLILEVTRAALEDAGYDLKEFPRERTSVILANAGHGPITAFYSLRSMLDWKLQHLDPALRKEMEDGLPEWTEDSFPGYLGNVIAGRVANRFDLGGLNYSIDAACGSSLAALHTAVNELRFGTSDVVLLAATDTHNQPGDYLSFSKTHAFSPGGRCRTFDATADGIVISEGIAMLVLRRLSDAEKDGDTIYAVIRGVGGSSDGKDLSLTAPRPQGQMLALNRAYEDAKLEPNSISLVEAHGTGTVAGDKAEIEALNKVFSRSTTKIRECAVGSVKTMIGHTKCTAGLASMIKVAKALHHKVLPPTIGVDVPNPTCKFETSPFYINSETRPWLRKPAEDGTYTPLRAGVSAFGFGGTNFHAVLEEYCPPGARHTAPGFTEWPCELFAFGGTSRNDVLRQVQALKEAVNKAIKNGEKRNALRDLAWWHYMRTADRLAGKQVRMAIVATSVNELLERLGQATQELFDSKKMSMKDPRGFYFQEAAEPGHGKIAFVMPGQGSQQPNMLKDLALTFPEVLNAFEYADSALSGKFDKLLSSYIFPPPAFSKEETSEQAAQLTDTRVAQPAVGAADLAMLDLMKSMSVEPDMLAGHSYGEYVALCAAGVMSYESLLNISHERGRLLSQRSTGTMAAVAAPIATVSDLVKAFPKVSIANINAPEQIVVAGKPDELERFVAHAQSKNVQARLIPVSQAFHTPAMEYAKDPLMSALCDEQMFAPTVPVYCNSDAETYPDEAIEIVQRLCEHAVKPVDFVKQIQRMYDDGARVFVEVGPGSVLTNLIGATLADKPHSAIALDRPGKHGVSALLHAVAQLVTAGVVPNLARLYEFRLSTKDICRSLAAEAAPASSKPEKARPKLQYRVNSHRIVRVKPDGSTEAVGRTANVAFRAQKSDNTQATSAAYATHASGKTTQSAPTPRPAAAPQHPAQSQPTGYPQGGYAAPQPQPGYGYGAPQTVQPLYATPQTQAGFARAAGVSAVDEVMLQFQRSMVDITNNFLSAQQQVMLSYLQMKGGQPVSPHAQSFNYGAGNEQAFYNRISELSGQFAQNQPIPQQGYPTAQQFTQPQPNQAPATQPYTYAATVPVNGNGSEPHHNGSEPAGNNGSGHAHAPAAAPVAEAKPQYTDEYFVETLLEVVSQRTGYPPDMLDPALDLEADLGIDSIKRVEILNSFRKQLPAEAQSNLESGLEQLAGTKTLQGIMDWIRTGVLTGGKGTAAATPAPQSTQTAAPALVPASVDAPATSAAPAAVPAMQYPTRRGLIQVVELDPIQRQALPEGTIVVCDDTDFGYEVVNQIGSQAVMLRHQKDAASATRIDGRYEANLTDEAQAASVLSMIREDRGNVVSLVHLMGMNRHDADSANGKTLNGVDAVMSLFLLTRGLDSEFRKEDRKGAAIVACTKFGGTFASGDNPPTNYLPATAGVIGFVKSAAREWQNAPCKVLDFEFDVAWDYAARVIIDELTNTGERVEIGRKGGQRYGLDVKSAEFADDQRDLTGSLDLNEQSVVLVTGGARGITAEVALELSQVYHPKLILLGRSPLPSDEEPEWSRDLTSAKDLKAAIMEQLRSSNQTVKIAAVEAKYQKLLREREMRAAVNALREAASHVEYHEVDVTDESAIASLVGKIYEDHGRIDGIINGAGVIEDAYLKDKQYDSFQRVYKTKVFGAIALANHVRLNELKFFTLFSSIVGRTGNAGQTDYVAANEVISKLSVALNNQIPGRVASFMWGPWQGGMAQPELAEIFAMHGWAMIERVDGRKSFVRELERGAKQDAEVMLVAEITAAPAELTAQGARLLGSSAVADASGTVEYTVILDLENDLYLHDHQIDGVPVLPMAMSLEMMSEAVLSANKGWKIARVFDMDIPSGVVIDTPRKAASIKVETVSCDSEKRHVRTTLSTGPGAMRARFCTNFELIPASATAPAYTHFPSQVDKVSDLGELGDILDETFDTEMVYRDWMFHGPMFQGIKSIEIMGAHGAIGEVKHSLPARCLTTCGAESWVIDPILLDGSMQLAGVWARRYLDTTVLPTGFRTLHRFDVEVAPPLTGRVVIDPNSNDRELVCEVAVYNRHGQLLLAVTGLGGVGSKALNRLTANRQSVSSGANR